MPDEPSPLRPANPNDVRDALTHALAFDGRKRFRHADDIMATITAEHLARHLELCGFVVLRCPPGGDFAGVARETKPEGA